MTEFKITPKVIVVGLMVTAFILPRMIDRTTWYGSLISWLCIGILICCAIYEISVWNNKRKHTRSDSEQISTPSLED